MTYSSKPNFPTRRLQVSRNLKPTVLGLTVCVLSSCASGSQERDEGNLTSAAATPADTTATGTTAEPPGDGTSNAAETSTTDGTNNAAETSTTDGTSNAAGTSTTDGTSNAAGTSTTEGTSNATGTDTEQRPAIENVLGSGVMGGSGSTTDQYGADDVTRDGMNFRFIANGWGPGWESHDISYEGTSFTINALEGKQGDNYEPASFPATLCGQYSVTSKPCGLPAAIDSLEALPTGWRWEAGGNTGEYNASYDIWLGDGTAFRSFLMVWLRDPPRQQPVGSIEDSGGTVPGVSGLWNIWVGTHLNSPIISYVYKGEDLSELEFDIVALIDHTRAEGHDLPGTHVLSVAVGFEIWNGPITNLKSSDFYVFP